MTFKINQKIFSGNAINEHSDVGIITRIFILLFWIGQIWTTPYLTGSEFTNLNYNPLFRPLDSLLQEATLIGKRFALYEAALVILLVLIVRNHSLGGLREKDGRRIFIVSFITVIICFLNPNNSFEEIKYLLSYQPRILLYFTASLFIFLSVEKQRLVPLLYYFIFYGFIIAFLQAALSSALFFMGKGVIFLNTTATLPNAEILNVMIIFSALALSLYLYSHNKKYLLLAFLFHVTIFFADRRTPMMVLIATDIILLFYFRRMGSRLIFKGMLVGALAVGMFYFLSSKTSVDLEYYFLRIYGVVSGNVQAYGDRFTDMGHWQQTKLTFITMLNNLNIFWGGGLRNDMFYVYGQSAYIHNSLAAVWALNGLPMTFYLIYIIFVFAKKGIMYIIESSRMKNRIILAPVVFAYIMILIGDLFTGEFFSKHFVYAALFVLALSFLRLEMEDEKTLLRRLLKREIN